MKITCLGAGTWGFSIASLLATSGHEVVLWGRREDHIAAMGRTREHPKLLGFPCSKSIIFTTDLKFAVNHAEMMVESVTTRGIRDLFGKIKEIRTKPCPIILTSKGIEQNTCLLLPEVAQDYFDRSMIGCISGPSHAEEVVRHLPTSIVCSAFDQDLMMDIKKAFNTPFFRVYPNPDIFGVSFGGALKNIIAIACGISDGLGFGDNTKAALMTRGLHEMRKLCPVKGGNPETLNGLSGLGDLCVTCLSTHSRNYRFGNLLAEGRSAEEAQALIGMVVEGVYSCVSAHQLSQKYEIPLPITEVVHAILYGGFTPKDAVTTLFRRAIKEEHL